MRDDDLLALERAGWAALSGAGGVGGAEHYRRTLTDDALMAFPFGVLDREQALEAIAAAPPWSTYELTGTRVLRLGAQAAVVVYAVTAQREGQPPFSAVLSSTWVHDGDRWRLAFHQQSPAAP